jgi:hypothetical protein
MIFHINVEMPTCIKLKLVKDSVSIFKGDVVVQVTGNSIENLQIFISKNIISKWKRQLCFLMILIFF